MDAAIRPLARWIAQRVVASAERRAAAGRLEFHDLLVLARRLLRTDPEVRESLHGQFPRLLLDKFQDTHPIQIELALRLVAPLVRRVGRVADRRCSRMAGGPTEKGTRRPRRHPLPGRMPDCGGGVHQSRDPGDGNPKDFPMDGLIVEHWQVVDDPLSAPAARAGNAPSLVAYGPGPWTWSTAWQLRRVGSSEVGRVQALANAR